MKDNEDIHVILIFCNDNLTKPKLQRVISGSYNWRVGKKSHYLHWVYAV